MLGNLQGKGLRPFRDKGLYARGPAQASGEIEACHGGQEEAAGKDDQGLPRAVLGHEIMRRKGTHGPRSLPRVDCRAPRQPIAQDRSHFITDHLGPAVEELLLGRGRLKVQQLDVESRRAQILEGKVHHLVDPESHCHHADHLAS